MLFTTRDYGHRQEEGFFHYIKNEKGTMCQQEREIEINPKESL